MSEYIHKSHNVSVLMYHEAVTKTLIDTCKEISERYEIIFLVDRDRQENAYTF